MGRHPKPPKAKTPEALQAMALELVGGYNDSLEERKKSKPMSNYASQIGHPCTFYLWAKRVHWEEWPTVDVGLRNIFALGDEHERAIQVRLIQSGFNVTKVQTAFTDEEHNVHGYMDWELTHPTRKGWQYPVTTEFKSTNEHIFKQLYTFEGLFDAGKKWLRLAPYQVLKYAAMDAELRPQLCVLYRCKSSGALRPLLANTADHVHKLEPVHDRLKVVNKALRTGKAPPALPYEKLWCEYCDAATFCPTMQKFEGANIATLIPEPAIIDAITNVWETCEEQKKMAVDAWADLKDQLAHYGGWTDLEPGMRREMIGARYRYPCKVIANGQKRLDTPVPIVAEEEGSGG